MEHPPTPPGVHSDDYYDDSPPLPNRGTPKVSKAKAMMTSQRLYKLSATKHKKRAKISKKIPKECTFKPKVNKRAKNKNRSGGPIGERLYKERANTQRRKEALKKRIQTETFKPQLATATKSRRSKRGASQKRITKLFNDSKSRDTKLRAAQKKKLQADKAHGYKPKISKKAREIKAGRVELNAGSSMMERAKKLAKQKKRRELKNCTFKPKLTRSRSAPKARVSGNFLQRMNAFEAKKGQNISKLLQKQYNREKKNNTFAPKREGAKRRTKSKSSASIGNRLYHMGREREKLLQKKIARKKMAEVKKHRFRPKIGRSRSAGRARPGKSRTSIYDRLYGESRLLKENRDKAIREKETNSMKGMFKPKIQSKVQAPSRDNRSSIWDRLAVQDVIQREATHVEFQSEREKREMEECSFAPVVDVEREEEEDGDIFDRLYETDIGATDYEATGVEECTFEPDLPVASQQIASYSTDGDVYERLSSLEAKQQLKREMQEKKKDMEVEGCTFTPDLSNNEKVYGGVKQPSTSKKQTFARLATPKNKIPYPTAETQRPVSSKKRGKSSFMERVRQKAKKSAVQTVTKPASSEAAVTQSIHTPESTPAPSPAAAAATSSEDEDSAEPGPLEF